MKIRTAPTFERNYKALKKKHYDMDKFEVVLDLLLSQDTEQLVRIYKDHALKGNKQGLRELHIEKD